MVVMEGMIGLKRQLTKRDTAIVEAASTVEALVHLISWLCGFVISQLALFGEY